jgi:CheY-like chemotaxis protein
MNILIVEDDPDKKHSIVKYIESLELDISLTEKESINSGLSESLFRTDLSLIILDMSMSIDDVTSEDPEGGGHESFAGKQFLEQMFLRGIKTPVIVVSQFGSFGKGLNKISLPLLDRELQEKHSDFYLGAIYYNSAMDEWKSELKDIIMKVFNID